ncbi:MAG: hypothetical protein ACFFDN_49135 [Candidatus Hodarchaeota archaeon]
MAVGKTGGILMLVSLFLPMWLINITGTIFGYRVSATMLYWLFGYYYVSIMGFTVTGISIEIFSIIIFVLILIFSVICISKEGTPQMVLGILALLAMIGYMVYWYLGLGTAYFTGAMGTFTVTLIPIGGILCIIGAILAISGGAKTK